jgi:methylated-DNA-[protein]-cysteine S-methyltransferase
MERGTRRSGPDERYHAELATTLGAICCAVDARGRLVGLRFDLAPQDARLAPSRCERVLDQLAEYFAGHRKRFELELAPHGTPFQRRVWQALTEIPYGKVASYGEIAHRIGRPGAARAVGQANGANPIPIVIPCHRVIAADGTIGGFSSGLGLKRRLLDLEHVRLAA